MEKFYWNDPTIIASVITCVFALFSGIMARYTYRNKKKFEVKFDKELESHRNWLEGRNKEIQSQLDTKLELLRIEYGTIFIKRLEVIEEIYDNLLQVQKFCTKLCSYDKSKAMDEENVKQLRKTSDNYNQFWNYFERKKIYLSEDLANVITCYLLSVNVKLYEKYPNELKGYLSVLSKEELSVFEQFLNIFGELKPTEVLNFLENEFRTLIGVEVTSKNIKNHACANL